MHTYFYIGNCYTNGTVWLLLISILTCAMKASKAGEIRQGPWGYKQYPSFYHFVSEEYIDAESKRRQEAGGTTSDWLFSAHTLHFTRLAPKGFC